MTTSLPTHDSPNLTDGITQAIARQRQFFATGQTKSLDFRLEQLRALKQVIANHADEITQALQADLRKPEFEAFGFEVAAQEEIKYALKHLPQWVKPQKAAGSQIVFPAQARIIPEPLGVVLIMAPWNYPFQLMISPLVGAIAAGNCAILKPSELTPHTSRLLADLISKTFDPGFVTVIEGGIETSQALLDQKFDHIFFTGGTEIGKVVMAAAAKHLTPVTLELGGKSPCIVDAQVDLAQAARRIAWGKFINAGQTCVAPDYLLVDQRIQSQFLAQLKTEIQAFYGENPIESPDFGRIVSDRHFQRLASFLEGGNIVIGGQTDASQRYIAPTVIDGVSLADPVMQSEIFGPILPVIPYEDLGEAIALINQQPKPLALYIFSTNSQVQQRILQETSSGGVCINDTILHIALSSLPFGGVGSSGMGSYHGKYSFDTFTHYKSVLTRGFRFDINWRFPPYASKIATLKKVLG